MMRLSNGLYRFSNGWVALMGLVVFVLFMAMVLPGQSAQAEAVSGEMDSPDMSFFYSPQDLYDMAEAYGESGRAAYIQARFTFDLVWPIVYTLFLTTAISWIFARGFSMDSRWRWANLVPVIGMFFDYLENISTSLVMFRYPESSPVIAWLAPFFTAFKWILVYGSFVLLLVGLVVSVWQTARNRRKG